MHPTLAPSNVVPVATPFKIVIVYENLAAGIRAQETAERLSRELNAETEVQVDLWKFELLDYPSMQEQAARDASNADMIIVSADANSKLPVHVRDWLEHIVPVSRRADANSALVALLGEDQQAPVTWEAQSTRDYLEQVADKRGMDFFCKTDPAFPDLRGAGHEDDIPTLAFLEESFTPDVGWRRWGIND